METVFIACFIIVFSCLLFFVIRSREKSLWNDGRCYVCDTPWKLFDIDSQGHLGYKCGCHKKHIIWVWAGWNLEKDKKSA